MAMRAFCPLKKGGKKTKTHRHTRLQLQLKVLRQRAELERPGLLAAAAAGASPSSIKHGSVVCYLFINSAALMSRRGARVASEITGGSSLSLRRAVSIRPIWPAMPLQGGGGGEGVAGLPERLFFCPPTLL